MTGNFKEYWFKVPWGFVDQSTSKKLSPSERMLLIVLLYCENLYTENPGDWFFTYNSELEKRVGVASSTLRSLKSNLEKAGYIETQMRPCKGIPNVTEVMHYRVIHEAFPTDYLRGKEVANQDNEEYEDWELPF